ncbi:hypothetical protein BH09MYX1_BH09MYX1_25000 [soil metagenome]
MMMNSGGIRQLVLAIGAAFAIGVGGACQSVPVEPTPPVTIIPDPPLTQRLDKIDLLLAIDNSASMADKQALLANAVPFLVD